MAQREFMVLEPERKKISKPINKEKATQ